MQKYVIIKKRVTNMWDAIFFITLFALVATIGWVLCKVLKDR